MGKTGVNDSRAALVWGLILAVVPFAIYGGLHTTVSATAVVVAGLAVFGIAFAINSALQPATARPAVDPAVESLPDPEGPAATPEADVTVEALYPATMASLDVAAFLGAIRLGLMYVNGLRKEVGQAMAAFDRTKTVALPALCAKCGCDDETLIELNAQIDVEGREPADVAFEWLQSEGFIE